jgi:rfaE bifunctional protein kinase chain/domain
MKKERVQELIESFKQRSILVIGDLMIDRYVSGRVRRISPEAPVPIVEVEEETCYPGGAANVARNLRDFCSSVSLAGRIGRDADGAELKRLLTSDRIKLDPVVEDEGCPTIVKTRVLARHQQVVRVDRERLAPFTKAHLQELLSKVETLLPTVDGVILEDYGKGLFTQSSVAPLLEACLKAGKIVTVDPNPRNPISWDRATAVKPNRPEAFAAAGLPGDGLPVTPPAKDESLLEVGRVLLEKWKCSQLLITLGEDGMMLFREGQPPYHSASKAREVFDVSGAGDTAIAFYTLALCSGATPEEAAELANHGAGIVVGKLGTATVSEEELIRSFSR